MVHNWLLALPDAVLLRHARLALDGALRYLESLHSVADAAYADARSLVERTLGRVEAGLRAPGAEPLAESEIAALQRRLRLLRGWIESRALLARVDAAGLAALVEETAGLAEGEEVRWKLIWLAHRFWLDYSLEREGTRLLPQLPAFKEEALAAGEHRAALTAITYLAYIYEAAGRLRRAERECLEGLALAERLGIAPAGYLHLCLGRTYYARNRPEEAAATLRALVPIARTWQQVDLLILALDQQAQLALTRGEPAAADAALREAEAIVRRERTTYHAPVVAATRVRYWLATGDPDSAARWAARAAFDLRAWDPTDTDAFLARVRVLIAQRRYPEAVTALDDFAAQLDRPGYLPHVVAYLALRLVALHHVGEREQARAVAARLLALTVPEGWLRPYLDEGPAMEAALATLLAAPDDETADAPSLPRAIISRLLATFDEEREAARHRAASATPEPGVPASADAARAAATPVEPLTRREREVLRHLADGASNKEIAVALAISIDTAKKHVGTLLGKLGAASRTQAVARARDAALL